MKTLLFAMLLSLISLCAMAIPPHGPDMVRTSQGPMNEWSVTYYHDEVSGLTGVSSHTQWATQRLCFYYAGVADAHQRYYVVSSSYPGWFGTATQEGDLVRVKLTFWSGAGNDEIYFDLSTMGPRDRGMGHWDETVETWSRFGVTFWGNTELQRVGRCEVAPQDSYRVNDYESAEKMLNRYRDDGLRESTPMGLNQNGVKQ